MVQINIPNFPQILFRSPSLSVKTSSDLKIGKRSRTKVGICQPPLPLQCVGIQTSDFLKNPARERRNILPPKSRVTLGSKGDIYEDQSKIYNSSPNLKSPSCILLTKAHTEATPSRYHKFIINDAQIL